MRKLYIGFGLALAFAMGCVSTRFVVPPAHAQNAMRWEYFCFNETGANDVREKLNASGAQGFELVATGTAVNSVTWCMKRPRP